MKIKENLTKEQHEALDKINRFLEDDSSNIFILTGRAGSGKSTLIPHIITKSKLPYKIMAPTGRAVKLLRDKLPDETPYTIHKSIYEQSRAKAEGDHEYLETVKFYFPIHVVEEATLFIIDEASLIPGSKHLDEILQYGSGNLLDDIVTSAGLLENIQSKIIFIGDKYQLPPVTDSESAALTQHFFENKNLATEQYELLGNLRQTNKSRIEQTAHQYSAQLDQAKEDRLLFEILPDRKTVYEIDSELFVEQFIKSGGTANSVIICYTNSDVYQYNERVRDILYPNKKSITVGDTIVFYKNNYYTYDEEIIAGDFAKITAVDDEVITRSVERVRNDRSGNPVRIEFKFRKIRFIIIDHPKQKEIETINWYGFHRFVSADYNETEYEGNQVLSMVEKTINTYLKAVQKAKPDGSLIGTDEQIEFAINEAKIIIEKHPEYNWTPYQLSKLLIELNRKDEAEKYLIPFARKNSHFYYVWETLAELYKGKDKDLYYACIFKALTIPNEVKFTVNIRKKAIEYFVNVTEDYAAAKYEIELIHQCIEKENWKTDDTIAALMTRPWYAEANPNKNNRNLYEKLSEVAEDALYSDIEEKDFYVEWINEARDLIGIILTNEERLIVKDAKLAKELEESSFYVAKIYTEGRPRIIGDCTVSENEQLKNKFIIQFSGIFEKIKDFGFIRHSNYNVFVNPALIDEYNIENYSRMTTINRKKFNSRKSIWEWEVHEIVNIERPQLENFEKEITGQLRETEHGFGFIDKCFVSANLINDNDIFDGDTVKVKAKKSWDRQKNEWSWRAEEVVGESVEGKV